MRSCYLLHDLPMLLLLYGVDTSLCPCALCIVCSRLIPCLCFLPYVLPCILFPHCLCCYGCLPILPIPNYLVSGVGSFCRRECAGEDSRGGEWLGLEWRDRGIGIAGGRLGVPHRSQDVCGQASLCLDRNLHDPVAAGWVEGVDTEVVDGQGVHRVPCGAVVVQTQG